MLPPAPAPSSNSPISKLIKGMDSLLNLQSKPGYLLLSPESRELLDSEITDLTAECNSLASSLSSDPTDSALLSLLPPLLMSYVLCRLIFWLLEH
jgi:hypothetical protein